jgi:hypothetical protein
MSDKIKILVCYNKDWNNKEFLQSKQKLSTAMMWRNKELPPPPKEDIFFPIQTGKATSMFDLKIQGDDTGDNISRKNETFAEYTALYWAWKNIKTLYPNIEYIGMGHYRRYFKLDDDFRYDDNWEGVHIHRYSIPKMENYEELIIKKLKNKDIILVKAEAIERSVKEHYLSDHAGSDLLCIKDIIHERCPEYEETFVNYIENSIALFKAMFIVRYELFEKYVEWLFPLLFEAEKRIDVSNRPPITKERAVAYAAERLFGVYVLHHKLKTVYRQVYFIMPKPPITIKTILIGVIKSILPYGIVRIRQIIRQKMAKNP